MCNYAAGAHKHNARRAPDKGPIEFREIRARRTKSKTKRRPAATPTYATLARRSKARSSTGTDPAADARGRKPGHDCRHAAGMPQLLACALRQRTGDQDARYVFGLGEWAIENAKGQACLITKLKTPDGFEPHTC